MNSSTLNIAIEVDDKGSVKLRDLGKTAKSTGETGEKSFKGFRAQVDKLKDSTDLSIKSFVKMGAISFSGTLAGVTAMTTGVVSLVNSSGQLAREMENSAHLAGMGSKEFQEYAFATTQFGVTYDKLGDISKDTHDKLGDFIATGAGGFKDFFENVAPKVGLTAQELQNLSGPDVLIAVKDAMDAANVSAEEQVFYLEAIASDVTLLNPLLEDGGRLLKQQADRADELGIALSSVDSQKLIEAQQKTAEVAAAMGGLKNHIAATLAPVVTDIGERLLAAMADGEHGVDNLSVAISDKLMVAMSVGLKGVEHLHVGWLSMNTAIPVLVDSFQFLGDSTYQMIRNSVIAPLDLAMEAVERLAGYLGNEFVNPFDRIQEKLDGVGYVTQAVMEDSFQAIIDAKSGYAGLQEQIDQYRKSIVATGDEAETAAVKQIAAVNTVAQNTIVANDAKASSDDEVAARMAKTLAELSAKRMAVDGEYLDSWQLHAERQTQIDKEQKTLQKSQQGDLESFLVSSSDTVIRRWAAGEETKVTVSRIAKDTIVGFAQEWASTAITEILTRHGAEIGANVALGTAETSHEGDTWQQKIATGAGYLAAATAAVYAGKAVGDNMYATGGYFETHGSGLINQGSGICDDVFLGYTDGGMTRNWGMRDEYAFIVNQDRTRRFLPVLDAMNFGDDHAIWVAFNNVFRADGGPVGDAWEPTRRINDAGFDTFWDHVIQNRGDWWGAISESIGYYAGTGSGILLGKALGKEVLRASGGPIGDRYYGLGGFFSDLLDPGGVFHDPGDTADAFMDIWSGGDPGTNQIWNDIAGPLGWNTGESYIDQLIKDGLDKMGLDEWYINPGSGGIDWGKIWNAARNLPIVGDTVERADNILYPFVRDAATPDRYPSWNTVEDMLRGCYHDMSDEVASWIDPLVGIGSVAIEDIGNWALGSYETGTDYVPRTGPYILHEGESVNTVSETVNKNEMAQELADMRKELTSANLKIISLLRSQENLTKKLCRTVAIWETHGMPGERS